MRYRQGFTLIELLVVIAITRKFGVSSYAANAQVFYGDPNLRTTFRDGTSSTILFAEHYAYDCQGSYFMYMVWFTKTRYVRRASFADGGPNLEFNGVGDIAPITEGNPPRARADHPYTIVPPFQVAPRVKDCIPPANAPCGRHGDFVCRWQRAHCCTEYLTP